MIRHAAKNFKNLKTDSMERRFGILYQDLKIKRGSNVFLQPAHFLGRRLILAVAVVALWETLIWQIFMFVL